MPINIMAYSIFPTVKLRSGRIIRATSLHIDYTYAGFLGGTPDESTNMSILKCTEERGTEIASGLPFLMINPLLSQVAHTRILAARGEPEYSVLPQFRIFAEFFSEPVEPLRKHMGSAIVLAWFEAKSRPIMGRTTREQIAANDWDKMAKNWDP